MEIHSVKLNPDYWPTAGWQTSSPEAQGMSSATLLEMHNYIAAQEWAIDAILIVRNGYIVFEEYSLGYDVNTLHFLYSCTKSVTSALIGIAINAGYISSLESVVVDFFSDRTIANLDAWKEAITVECLLAMKAGFEWDEWTFPYTDYRNDAIQMISSFDAVQFVLDLPMASAPGTEWVYNTGASHLLSAIINTTTGMNTREFAQANLFGPLGITHLTWGTDFQGLSFGGHDMYLTPRDMAKFGFLFLNDGEWDGQQVIPAAWVQTSTDTHTEVWSETGYGYQWWTNSYLDSFEARGYLSQSIIVIQDHELVIVFTATQREGGIPYTSIVHDYILEAINGGSPITTPSIIPGIIVICVLATVLPVTTFVIYKMWQKRQ